MTNLNNGDETYIETDIEFENITKNIAYIKDNIKTTIFGQDETIDLCLACIFSSSHALLIGMPGVAKTSIVEAISIACGLSTKRIQFTPDLMPSDILGGEVLDTDSEGKRSFRFIEGPIFTQLLMADEINRASPKTQSALLQAMQEERISIAGKDISLPKPFSVLATQNPIDHEGAYALPEAQLDRFLLQINVPYPDEETEKLILKKQKNAPKAKSKIKANDIIAIQDFIDKMPISEKLINTIIAIIRELRPQTTSLDEVKNNIEWGPGPRGTIALMNAAKSYALINNNLSPSLSDLYKIIEPALQHRIKFNWNANKSGINLPIILDKIYKKIGL